MGYISGHKYKDLQITVILKRSVKTLDTNNEKTQLELFGKNISKREVQVLKKYMDTEGTCKKSQRMVGIQKSDVTCIDHFTDFLMT